MGYVSRRSGPARSLRVDQLGPVQPDGGYDSPEVTGVFSADGLTFSIDAGGQIAAVSLDGSSNDALGIYGPQILRLLFAAYTAGLEAARHRFSASVGRVHDPVEETCVSPSTEAVRSGFGLTKQQTRIAFLLAERRTDKEIADVLSISPFTVRRHVEEILSKLEIHSRRDVAARLSES